MQVDKAEEILPEKVGHSKEEKDKSRSNKDGGDERTGDTAVEVDGDNVVTESVPRGAETTYHTRLLYYFIETDITWQARRYMQSYKNTHSNH